MRLTAIFAPGVPGAKLFYANTCRTIPYDLPTPADTFVTTLEQMRSALGIVMGEVVINVTLLPTPAVNSRGNVVRINQALGQNCLRPPFLLS